MIQKLLIGGLFLAIVGIIGFGLMDANRAPDESPLIADALPTQTSPEEQTAEPTTEPTLLPTLTPTVPILEATVAPMIESTQETPLIQAGGAMGDVWVSAGAITVLEDFGFTLSTMSGDFYVDLGPPTYWQAQGIALAVGDAVNVDGYYNGDQVHARVVTVNGAQLVIRTEDGQPMWAGGASTGGSESGNGNGTSNASGTTLQVAPEDWLTLTGIIGTVTNGNVTLNVDDGTILNLQMGQPTFWQSQGVILEVGDPVEVLGFWSGNQFMVGEVRKTETGEIIMLRDPNGRQLWAGPGRSGGQGSSGGQGNGGQGNGNQGEGNQGEGNQGNGNQGNGYQGGRNEQDGESQ